LIAILPTIHYYSSHLLERSTQTILREKPNFFFMNIVLGNDFHHNLKSNGITHPWLSFNNFHKIYKKTVTVNGQNILVW